MKLTKQIKTAQTRVFFMSDLHYGHENIIRLCSRPYETVEQMNEYILGVLQNTLQPGDIVFDLGDMAWKIREDELNVFLDSFNGSKVYKILGNHDSYNLYRNPSSKKIQDRFELITDFLEIVIDDIPISLFHYPIRDFPGMYRGALHLFGHVHGNLDESLKTESRLMADVGFDAELSKRAGSFLVPFNVILEYFKEKTGGLEFKEFVKSI